MQFPRRQQECDITLQDMAGAILFLTSRAGAFLNGNVVLLDGGSIGNEPGSY